MTARILEATTVDPFQCPEWCVEDHTGDDPGDCFHRGEITAVKLPTGSTRSGTRLLMTHLVVHSVTPAESCIAIGDTDGGFDLTTPERVDQYLSQLTDHLFQVRALRDQLAAIQAD